MKIREISPESNQKKTIFEESDSENPPPFALNAHRSRYHEDVHLKVCGQIPALGVYMFPQGRVGHNGVVYDEEMHLAYSEDMFGGKAYRDALETRIGRRDSSDPVCGAMEGKLEILDLPPEHVAFVVCKPGYQVYGHWILDILPTVWMFATAASRLGIDPGKLKYVLPGATPAWARAMLKSVFGIDDRSCLFFNERKSTVRASTVLLPSVLRFRGWFSTEMNAYVDHVLASAAASAEPLPDRIFISRQEVTSFIRRRTLNADDLERAAESAGYTVLDPSKLDWPAQLKMFSKAKCVVGPFGSGMHNTLFSPGETLSLVLGAARMNWFQSGISSLRQQRMSYLFPEHEVVENGEIILGYSLDKFKRMLDEMNLLAGSMRDMPAAGGAVPQCAATPPPGRAADRLAAPLVTGDAW